MGGELISILFPITNPIVLSIKYNLLFFNFSENWIASFSLKITSFLPEIIFAGMVFSFAY